MSKCLVAGSRLFTDYSLLEEELQNKDITEIISGTANGADKMGEHYATVNNLKISRFPADWEKYGRAAGHVRNKEMALLCDFAIIFWDGISKGTENMIENMRKTGKYYYVVRYDEPDLNEW